MRTPLRFPVESNVTRRDAWLECDRPRGEGLSTSSVSVPGADSALLDADDAIRSIRHQGGLALLSAFGFTYSRRTETKDSDFSSLFGLRTRRSKYFLYRSCSFVDSSDADLNILSSCVWNWALSLQESIIGCGWIARGFGSRETTSSNGENSVTCALGYCTRNLLRPKTNPNHADGRRRNVATHQGWCG